MPAYGRLSRDGLTAVALPLLAAARALRPEPVVQAAAEAAEAAADALRGATLARQRAGGALRGAARSVRGQEAALDHQIVHLHRALAALAALGDAPAAEAQRALFPEGSRALTKPAGRAQAVHYQRLLRGIDGLGAHPALLRLAPYPATLRAGLEAFLVDLLEKDDQHRGRSATASEARAATEALRRALQQLDLAVQLATGGPRTAAYAAWAAAAGGLV